MPKTEPDRFISRDTVLGILKRLKKKYTYPVPGDNDAPALIDEAIKEVRAL